MKRENKDHYEQRHKFSMLLHVVLFQVVSLTEKQQNFFMNILSILLFKYPCIYFFLFLQLRARKMKCCLLSAAVAVLLFIVIIIAVSVKR